MGKLGFWIIVAAIAIGGYRLMQIMERKTAASRRGGLDADKRVDDSRELIMACDHCGVYVPASDAIMRNDKAYCCEQHRDLAANRSDS